uniref:Ankyrin repeat domain-containing protein 53-like n=1 Tax=Haplochromis burtoni TaxID=8153 RepID=A0A3Q2WBP8_HAPBU
MATMEPVNKPGKRRRGRCKKGKQSHYDALSRQMFPAVAPGNPEKCDLNENQLSLHQQSLPPLHVACLYGELGDVQLLVKSRQQWINSSDSQGRRPLHMVLSYKSFPRTCACLRYLLEHDADVNATTDLGQTPLHLAASEGFLDCAEILVKAGADVLAKDSLGQTPLDLACIWCHRKVARYLKSCMWHVNKEKERKERVLVQALYSDLVGMAKQNNLTRKTLTDEKVAEWAKKKGVALLKDFSLREQASSQRNPSQNPTSVTASPFGGTAPAGNFSTPPGGTARLAPLLTCLWMSLRGCCFPEPSLPGSPGHRTLSHRTWWRSSIKDALRSTTPPPGQRWPCVWLRCWSLDSTDFPSLG